jgi:hypothetical protein
MSDTKNNTGYRNTGYWNTGDWNTGDRNTGDCNTGYWNTGDRNTGYRNTGYWNTGDWNTGDRNTGDCNTGDWNTGDRNTGYWNTGDRNTGYWNTGDWNTGMFNTDEPNARFFGKESNIKMSKFVNSEAMPSCYDFDLTVWIEESIMTDKEKEGNPTYKTTGGYLKTIEYKEAWAIFWRKTSEENKKKFLNLPNFCAEIFKEITGIDVEEKPVVEVTLQEVADKLGVPIETLRIKD